MTQVNQDLLEQLIDDHTESSKLLHEYDDIKKRLNIAFTPINRSKGHTIEERIENELSKVESREDYDTDYKRIQEIKDILHKKVSDQQKIMNTMDKEEFLSYKSLADSISKEDYESAAFYRDQILKKKLMTSSKINYEI